jgi:O-antigen/teichoic acid export membrane protein
MGWFQRHFTKSPSTQRILRGSGWLLGGQAISQLILIPFYPLLTRLYTPENFGEYAFFQTIVGIFLILIFLRLEEALVLKMDENEAKKLWSNCLKIALATFSISIIILLIIKPSWQEKLNLSVIEVLLYFGLYGIGAGGLLLISQWLLRWQNYKAITQIRIWQSMGLLLMSVIFGYLEFGAKGLIMALSFSQMIAWFAIRKSWNLPAFTFQSEFKKQILKWKDFPLYNASSGIIENIGRSIPIWALLWLWTAEETGFFSLATRILALPVTLIAASYGQVLYRQLVDWWPHQKQMAAKWIYKTWLSLAAIAILPAIILMVYGEPIFVILFGKQWAGIGNFLIYLTPVFMIMGLVLPTSQLFLVARKQQILLSISLGQIITRLGSFYVGYQYGSLDEALIMFMITELLWYLVIVLQSVKILRNA